MSLSKEQKKDLNQISEYLKKIERIGVSNNIDLDVFMTDYNKDGFAVYATERISLNANSDSRKKVFEGSEKEKSKSPAKNR